MSSLVQGRADTFSMSYLPHVGYTHLTNRPRLPLVYTLHRNDPYRFAQLAAAPVDEHGMRPPGFLWVLAYGTRLTSTWPLATAADFYLQALVLLASLRFVFYETVQILLHELGHYYGVVAWPAPLRYYGIGARRWAGDDCYTCRRPLGILHMHDPRTVGFQD